MHVLKLLEKRGYKIAKMQYPFSLFLRERNKRRNDTNIGIQKMADHTINCIFENYFFLYL